MQLELSRCIPSSLLALRPCLQQTLPTDVSGKPILGGTELLLAEMAYFREWQQPLWALGTVADPKEPKA